MYIVSLVNPNLYLKVSELLSLIDISHGPTRSHQSLPYKFLQQARAKKILMNLHVHVYSNYWHVSLILQAHYHFYQPWLSAISKNVSLFLRSRNLTDFVLDSSISDPQ